MINFERYETKPIPWVKPFLISVLALAILYLAGKFIIEKLTISRIIPDNFVVLKIGSGQRPVQILQEEFESISAYDAAHRLQLQENHNYLLTPHVGGEQIRVIKSMDDGVIVPFPDGDSLVPAFIITKEADQLADGDAIYRADFCVKYIGHKLYKKEDGGKKAMDTFKELPCPPELWPDD